MRSILAFLLVSAALVACGGNSNSDDAPEPPCSDGEDNDGDGMIDFPDDLGCTAEADDSEDSLTSAKCQDGRDNDGDGRRDYPSDPGCFAPQADEETDDCPTGPNCPQCADTVDNNEDGAIDFPNDPGCQSAADDDEYLHNPIACGTGLMIMPLPPTGIVTGMLDGTSTSMVMSPCGGGGGAPAIAYELHLSSPRVVEISTDDAATTADTVIDIRGDMCMATTAEIACSDDISSSNSNSKLTRSLPAGNYYIIVGAHDSGSGGAFSMQVKTFAGEGSTCATVADCGPGLVCRVPLGMTGMQCSKPQCDDGVDDDQANDGADYPMDPGCTSATDNDEADDCPNGPNCPECGDDDDNDSDSMIDYPQDTTCLAAGDSSESCPSTDGVALLTMPSTMGDTAMAVNDVTPTPSTCGAFSGHTAPDKTYRLDVPALTSLSIGVQSTFSNSALLFNSSCQGAPVVCKTFSSATSPLTSMSLAGGTYYLVVDGYSTGSGTYTITTAGKIANGASCESALAQSGALTCATGYACKGTMGARTCEPALCSDNVDNDTDGKKDYPADPGCDSPADDTENDTCPGGAGCPVCANALDEDNDTTVDWPADYGCVAASGTSEVFCMPETDPTALITSTPVTGTTAGATNTLVAAPASCSFGAGGPEKVFALSLPVPVLSLRLDTSGSTLSDTVLYVKDAACTAASSFGCDDDGGDSLQSLVTMTNVAPGNYAVVVDSYSSTAGAFTLAVKGTVAAGTVCTSPLFTGGANAVLTCPTACTAGVCQ